MANDINDYLKSLLSFPGYTNSPEDKKLIEAEGLESFITGKLSRKKFRKSKIADNTKENIKKKVECSIKENKPLYLIICFGGYKHFWVPSHPEIDWAELFNLNFLGEYISPIIANYKPGVILDYESEDVILPLIDNYAEDYLDKYADSFK